MTKSDLQVVLYITFENCHNPKKYFLRDMVEGEI